MAGPLSGIGGQAQVTPSQLSPTQQNQNSQTIRPQDDQQEPVNNEVQPQGAAAAQTQESETQNAFEQRLDEFASLDVQSAIESGNTQRGSLLDVLV